ncbi:MULTISPECIES: Gfo/Idh/MocA family protein [unclassified Aureimonas]|uniref:Gfo/Idh/MocA family protein n=1 Tax=unclassified Aureimonas TaxID=2615206 RepID=UPI0006FE61EC|nr:MULTISPECIES: Gfo/Idh/MocA family oxidoreductase [unclassified Aureimonas]KQT69058.1 oxidoreductase [Aureimonas sp. Leaf460]KQT69295.1 oxidoreductase [Aureimonas sp. Leaf427]
MTELRGGLIGCGFFANNHLNAWRDLSASGDGAAIVALCDRDEARLASVAKAFGIGRTYTDAKAMFEAEALDFVDIATTAPTHRALVELAAAHKVPVICQKPMAPTIADGRAMVAACEAAGVPMMVHENFRWQKPIMAVEEIVRSGAIGKPFWGRVSFRSGYDVISGQPYLAEGTRFIIEDLGVHVLDTARFLFGEVSRLTASTAQVNPTIKGEDVATMLLVHEGGVTSVVDCSYSSRRARELFPEVLIDVEGSEGSVQLDAGYQLTLITKDGPQTRDVSPTPLAWAEQPWHGVQESVLNIERHFIETLRAGTEPATSGADNLKTFELVEAAYLSAATGRTVDPSEAR